MPPTRRLIITPKLKAPLDAKGATVFRSGFIKPDGLLDESAHVYKAILLDQAGRTLTRHQIRTTTVKAYDNTIARSRPAATSRRTGCGRCVTAITRPPGLATTATSRRMIRHTSAAGASSRTPSCA